MRQSVGTAVSGGSADRPGDTIGVVVYAPLPNGIPFDAADARTPGTARSDSSRLK